MSALACTMKMAMAPTATMARMQMALKVRGFNSPLHGSMI